MKDIIDTETVWIIMPVFNRADKIEKAAFSCLNQTYNNIRLVIVDDHSSDNTAKVINDLALKDDRVIILKTPDKKKGANAARNEGLKICKNGFITFCDSDDYLLPNSIDSRLLYRNAGRNRG